MSDEVFKIMVERQRSLNALNIIGFTVEQAERCVRNAFPGYAIEIVDLPFRVIDHARPKRIWLWVDNGLVKAAVHG